MRRLVLPTILSLSGIAAIGVWGFAPWLWPLLVPLAGGLMLLLFLAAFNPSWKFYGEVVRCGGAGRPQVALTFDDGPDPKYTGEVLSALEAGGDQPGALPNGDSIRAAFEGLTFQVAEAIQGANLALSVETASAAQLQNILSSETGVSIDEELILMAQADQAFQAASTFITEAQQMQDTLLAMVG